jgi:hypothetical protein
MRTGEDAMAIRIAKVRIIGIYNIFFVKNF